MHRVMLVKKLGSLHPVDADGEAVLRTLAQGEIVAVDLVRPRNIAHHRKLFAMLQIVLANQEHYKSMDDLLDVAKLRVGHCRTVLTKQGEVKIPSSISFASMDQVEFNAFYDRVCDWVLLEVIPGLRRKDLNEEVEALLMGFAAA